MKYSEQPDKGLRHHMNFDSLATYLRYRNHFTFDLIWFDLGEGGWRLSGAGQQILRRTGRRRRSQHTTSHLHQELSRKHQGHHTAAPVPQQGIADRLWQIYYCFCGKWVILSLVGWFACWNRFNWDSAGQWQTKLRSKVNLYRVVFAHMLPSAALSSPPRLSSLNLRSRTLCSHTTARSIKGTSVIHVNTWTTKVVKRSINNNNCNK